MSNSNPTSPADRNQRLESYLDGLLSADEVQQFEQELADDPQLQQEVQLQGQIDESLSRMFVAPDAPVDILALADSAPTDGPLVDLPPRDPDLSRKHRRIILTVLAASLAWAIVGWRVYVSSTDDGYRELALADIYEKCVDDGFQPKWVCDDDREFAETFQRRQGVPLLLKPESQDVMVGLSYLKGVSPKTTTMLARVDNQPVLVFVDRLDRDTRPEKPSWSSGLHLFRQELDGLVLYEITPLPEARVLSSFFVPSELPAGEGLDESTAPEESENS